MTVAAADAPAPSAPPAGKADAAALAAKVAADVDAAMVLAETVRVCGGGEEGEERGRGRAHRCVCIARVGRCGAWLLLLCPPPLSEHCCVNITSRLGCGATVAAHTRKRGAAQKAIARPSTPSPLLQNVDAAVDALLASEKTARLAEDTASTKLAAIGVVRVLARARQWAALGDAVATLAKRRGQAKQVIQAVVREAAALVLPSAAAGQHVAMDDDAAAAPPPSLPRPDNGADRDALIAALLTVTEGKIYVEIDRARLTRTLAAAKEATGDVDGAAALLQEVAVETFGAMAKTEKIDYILEQVRLCLDKGDFVR